MKYRNKTDQDLIVGGQLVKAKQVIDTQMVIENPNFEIVEDVVPQNQTPVPPPSAPVVGQATAPASAPPAQPLPPGGNN